MNELLLRPSRWNVLIMAILSMAMGCASLQSEQRCSQTQVEQALKWLQRERCSQGWDPDAPNVRIRIAQLQADEGAFEAYLSFLETVKDYTPRTSVAVFMAGFIPSPRARGILKERLLPADDDLRLEMLLSLKRQDASLEPHVVDELLQSTESIDVMHWAMTFFTPEDVEEWRPIYRRLLQDARPAVRELASTPPWDDAEARLMAKNWLRTALKSASAQALSDDPCEWPPGVLMAVQYLHDRYAIPQTPSIMSGGLGLWAKRILDITDRIDSLREGLLESVGR